MTEEQLLRLTIDPQRLPQFVSRLSNDKTRDALLDKVNHSAPLHPRRTTWYSNFNKAVANLTADRNCTVYLISSASKLDRRSMTLQEALEAVPQEGWATIIGISENLALFYDELGERAAIIRL